MGTGREGGAKQAGKGKVDALFIVNDVATPTVMMMMLVMLLMPIGDDCDVDDWDKVGADDTVHC